MPRAGERPVTDSEFRRPTKQELAAAAGKAIPDVIRPGLRVLFCGINPGLYSGAVGRHFARPGNRFWPALHFSGFTDRQLSPFEDHLLPDFGIGVINLVQRATATASELSATEMTEGAAIVAEKVRRYRPKAIAFVGIGAYRAAFGRPGGRIGPQLDRIEQALVWVLPNPSGLNAGYQLPDFVEAFRALRAAVEAMP